MLQEKCYILFCYNLKAAIEGSLTEIYYTQVTHFEINKCLAGRYSVTTLGHFDRLYPVFRNIKTQNISSQLCSWVLLFVSALFIYFNYYFLYMGFCYTYLLQLHHNHIRYLDICMQCIFFIFARFDKIVSLSQISFVPCLIPSCIFYSLVCTTSSPVTVVVRTQAVKTPATYRRDLGSTSGLRFIVVKAAGISPSVLVLPMLNRHTNFSAPEIF